MTFDKVMVVGSAIAMSGSDDAGSFTMSGVVSANSKFTLNKTYG